MAVCFILAVFGWQYYQWRLVHAPRPLATKAMTPVAAKLLYGAGEEQQPGPGAKSFYWDPLQRQVAEPDTLFLLDVAAERARGTAEGAFMAAKPDNADDPWRDIVIKPGKYRPGLRCMSRKLGYVWLPTDGIFSPDEFTVEFWLQADQPWSQLKKELPLQIGGDDTGSCNLRFFVDGGRLQLSFDHWQTPAAPSENLLEYDVRGNPIDPAVWTSVAATFAKGTLKLFVNGAEVASKDGIPVPSVWSNNAKRNGLCLGGAPGGGTEHCGISDLRISRRARVLKQSVPVDASNVLTVWPREKVGASIQQNLLGGLHTLDTPKTEQMAKGTLKVLRTDKLLTVTPIKFGAPDKAHPTLGFGGKYSYDWQVVDRTFAYMRRLGVTPYVSVDGTPKILGGEVPPFSGEKLKTKRSFSSSFGSQEPNDFEEYGLIVQDLVHYILREKKYTVGWWGIWNEPNSSEFWKGDLNSYLKLYEVCASAVRAVDPAAKVGGPECSRYEPEWLEGLIRYCGQRELPLDFVSWHYYSGSVAQLSRFATQVAVWSSQYGLKQPPELVVGEWCWQISNMPKGGLPPFRNWNYFINDWHAAFAAQSLIEMQRCGVAASIYTNPVAEKDAKGWKASGLMSPAGPWANWNVFRMWHRMALDVVRSSYSGAPGILAVASTDGKRVTVLIANKKFRKESPTELSLKLPGISPAAKLKMWLIDDRHSNAFEAGPAHSELETVPPPRIQNGTAKLQLPSRGVVLLEVTN